MEWAEGQGCLELTPMVTICSMEFGDGICFRAGEIEVGGIVSRLGSSPSFDVYVWDANDR
jgi:hypothetical protein